MYDNRKATSSQESQETVRGGIEETRATDQEQNLSSTGEAYRQGSIQDCRAANISSEEKPASTTEVYRTGTIQDCRSIDLKNPQK